MAEFTELIEKIEQMPFESQEIFIDIINKRFSEKKRELFVEETLKSKKLFEAGKYKTGNSEDLFKTLNI